MAFINRIIGPDEELVGIARVHWIYGAKGLLWLGGLIVAGGMFNLYISGLLEGGLSAIGSAVFWIATGLGAVLFLFYYVMMLFTELGLTTKRFIYKRGLLFVDVREIDLEEVKSANVDNGILGRLLNYGYVQLDARFIADISLPAISDPYRFMKALNEVRSDIKEDSMHVVLEQHGGAQHVAEDLRQHPEHGDVQQDKHNPDEIAKTKNENDDPDDKDHKRDHLKMQDDRYKTLSNNPAENMEDWAEELHVKPASMEQLNSLKKAEMPKVFHKKKNKNQPQKKGKHKLFVHTQALHDGIIEDFEEAEEAQAPAQEKEQKA